MSDEDDPETLRERVAELEQTVEQQSETIAKMLPGRRAILSGAVGASLGAAGMFSATERASAQASGQVGTSSKPLDVEGYAVNVQNKLTASGTNALIDVAASGSVTLSSGSAIETVETASGSTYYLALGTDDNAKVSGRIFDDGSVKVEIVETDTNVGNPTVEYDVLRVR